VVNAEWNGQYIHGYNPAIMPIDSPAPINGLAPNGIATRFSAAYRLGSKIDFANVGVFRVLSFFMQYQDEYHGNSPFPRSLYTDGRRSLGVGFAGQFGNKWTLQAYYQGQLNHDDAADFDSDRRYVSVSLTRTF
jgi:hypothetical protein